MPSVAHSEPVNRKIVMFLQVPALSAHVPQALINFLQCGWLEHGFRRAPYTEWPHELRVGFRYKRVFNSGRSSTFMHLRQYDCLQVMY